jgi:acyl-coenzyme A thioesterase PaaI-like protein
MDMPIPPGFAPWARGGSPATDPWEPIYARLCADRVDLGVHVRPALGNSHGIVHGAVISALTDIAMGWAYAEALRGLGHDLQGVLTLHLAADFLGNARDGWLAVAPRVVSAGTGTGHVDALVTVDGKLIARAAGAFKPIFKVA